MRISSWNFVRVLWAHLLSLSLKFSPYIWFLPLYIFARLFWRAREALVKQPPGTWALAAKVPVKFHSDAICFNTQSQDFKTSWDMAVRCLATKLLSACFYQHICTIQPHSLRWNISMIGTWWPQVLLSDSWENTCTPCASSAFRWLCLQYGTQRKLSQKHTKSLLNTGISFYGW